MGISRINNQLKNVSDATLMNDGVTLRQALTSFRASSVNGLATGQTAMVIKGAATGIISGARFIPTGGIARLAAVTGTPAGAAIIRIGNDGSFLNMIAATTLTGLGTLNNVLPLTLAAAPSAVDIGSAAPSVDVTTAVTVASVYTLDVIVYGWLI